jgi:hypothetical protein
MAPSRKWASGVFAAEIGGQPNKYDLTVRLGAMRNNDTLSDPSHLPLESPAIAFHEKVG